jgi:histidyl-tRNA synthetase
VINSGAGTGSAALRASEQLRAAGLDVLMHAGGGSFKSQFKRADASGAALALIIGEDELARGQLGLKRLRDAGGEGGGTGADTGERAGEGAGTAAGKGRQQSVPVDQLVETVVSALLQEQ